MHDSSMHKAYTALTAHRAHKAHIEELSRPSPVLHMGIAELAKLTITRGKAA